MSRGTSGRVVVEIDPQLKRELYAELIREGRTLKDWFIDRAERYVESRRQPALFAAEPPGPRYSAVTAAKDDQ